MNAVTTQSPCFMDYQWHESDTVKDMWARMHEDCRRTKNECLVRVVTEFLGREPTDTDAQKFQLVALEPDPARYARGSFFNTTEALRFLNFTIGVFKTRLENNTFFVDFTPAVAPSAAEILKHTTPTDYGQENY